ncbi:MAG TPA: hypothetical protein VMO47_03205 [Rhodothermales bacterium]|nr:hypothetical protein [Rhodothermales bacterium]
MWQIIPNRIQSEVFRSNTIGDIGLEELARLIEEFWPGLVAAFLLALGIVYPVINGLYKHRLEEAKAKTRQLRALTVANGRPERGSDTEESPAV